MNLNCQKSLIFYHLLVGGCIVQPIGLKDFSALFLIFFVLFFFRKQSIGFVVFFFNSVIRQSFDSHVIVEFKLSKVFNILSPIGGCIVLPIGLKDFSVLFLIFFCLNFFQRTADWTCCIHLWSSIPFYMNMNWFWNMDFLLYNSKIHFLQPPVLN